MVRTHPFIAKAIGQTHPSVSNIVKELKAAGLVSDGLSDEDRRVTIVTLTDRGHELKDRLGHACEDVESVVRSIESKSPDKLWLAINSWEEALSEKSLLKRVIEEKARHDSRNVEIEIGRAHV